MKLLIETQQNHVGSEVLARIAIIRPILMALLTGIKQEVLTELGGMENMKLFMLPRAYREGCGDVGFCFEWAVHDAIRRQDPLVMERILDASKLCKLRGTAFQSILFGVEKSGKTRIIDTANQLLTDDSIAQIQEPPYLRRSRVCGKQTYFLVQQMLIAGSAPLLRSMQSTWRARKDCALA